MEAHDIDVVNVLEVAGNVKANEVEVGGKFEVGKELTADRVRVGGTVRVAGATRAGAVEVGGKVELHHVELENLSVGGSAEVGSGIGRDGIEIGGRFVGGDDLTFGRLEVGGIARVRTFGARAERSKSAANYRRTENSSSRAWKWAASLSSEGMGPARTSISGGGCGSGDRLRSAKSSRSEVPARSRATSWPGGSR